jgi:hypothetical protein
MLSLGDSFRGFGTMGFGVGGSGGSTCLCICGLPFGCCVFGVSFSPDDFFIRSAAAADDVEEVDEVDDDCGIARR